MNPQGSLDHNGEAVALLRSVLKSQYHATLAMLRQAIERCPDTIWSGGGYPNPSWRVAYHVLYFTHLYLMRDEGSFRPWEQHQTNIQCLDNLPAPPEIENLLELPHRPPHTGQPYTKEQVLEYWDLCDRMIDEGVDALDLLAPNSGFSWYRVSKLEHQFVNVRHVQHHMAQLTDRIRATANVGVDWVSARSGSRPSNQD